MSESTPQDVAFTFAPNSPPRSPGGTRITVGANCLDRIGADLESGADDSTGSIAVFAGCGAMRKQGFLDRLAGQFGHRPVRFLEGITANPTLASCQHAADFLVDLGPVTALIAIGGGSVADTAKVANVAAGTGATVADLLDNALDRPFRRHTAVTVAVPTTAGTGAEVTPFATVWDIDAGQKRSLDHCLAQFTCAYLDPTVTLGLPKILTVDTAVDALGHALESIWSRQSTPLSRSVAAEAVRIITRTLPEVLDRPTDPGRRADLQWASLLGGMAISMTHTAAAHAISYPLTLRFGIAHGRAVGLLLPHVLERNLPALDEDALSVLASGFACAKVAELPAAVGAFFSTIGMAESLTRHGVEAEHIEELVAQSNAPGRMDNNIKTFDRHDIETLLRSAM